MSYSKHVKGLIINPDLVLTMGGVFLFGHEGGMLYSLQAVDGGRVDLYYNNRFKGYTTPDNIQLYNQLIEEMIDEL